MRVVCISPSNGAEAVRHAWILLSVTIELLRHYLATSPDMSETEDRDTSDTEDYVVSETQEIEWICTILQNRRFKPGDCTEDAVRYHFENFKFPALTHIKSTLSTYGTKDEQEPIILRRRYTILHQGQSLSPIFGGVSAKVS